MRASIFGLLLLSASAGPMFAFADYPYAFSFQTIRTPALPLDDLDPGQGQWAVRTSARWVNIWSYQMSRYAIDGEEVQVEPSVRYSPIAHVQIGLSVPWKSQGGGTMDGAVERFHQSFGFQQVNRDRFPRNRWNVSYEPLGPAYGLIDNDPMKTILRRYYERSYPRSPIDPPVPVDSPMMAQRVEIVPAQSSNREGTGNPRLTIQHDLNSFFTYGAQAKVSTGQSALLSEPGNDLGVYGVLKKSLAPWLFAKAGLSYTRYTAVDFFGLSLPADQWVFRGALEMPRGLWTFFSEYVYFTRAVNQMGGLSKPGHELAFGAHRDIVNEGTPLRMTVSVVENLVNFGVTPDIGFLFSFEAHP